MFYYLFATPCIHNVKWGVVVRYMQRPTVVGWWLQVYSVWCGSWRGGSSRPSLRAHTRRYQTRRSSTLTARCRSTLPPSKTRFHSQHHFIDLSLTYNKRRCRPSADIICNRPPSSYTSHIASRKRNLAHWFFKNFFITSFYVFNVLKIFLNVFFYICAPPVLSPLVPLEIGPLKPS